MGYNRSLKYETVKAKSSITQFGFKKLILYSLDSNFYPFFNSL